MKALIPVMRPRLPAPSAALSRLEAVHAAGIFSNFGPQVTELEMRFAELLRVEPDRVVTAANATLALAGAMAVGNRAKWIMPSFTFTASVAAGLLSGCDVRLGDIDRDAWWLDPGAPVSDRGVLAVAPFGGPLDLERYAGHDEVVIDAAASLGNLPDLDRLPASWAVVFSLHATKVLGAGEGAIAVFGGRERAQRFRMWTNFGFFGARESQLAGINAKMSEMQAAYAHAVLDSWDEERAQWLAARDLVLGVGDELEISTFWASREAVTPYWIVVFPDAATTDLVERVLEEHGIGIRRWWSRGCHRMPAFADVPCSPLPITEDVADRYLGLPMFRGLEARDAERIRSALLDAADLTGGW